jgi:hypothetical protein
VEADDEVHDAAEQQREHELEDELRHGLGQEIRADVVGAGCALAQHQHALLWEGVDHQQRAEDALVDDAEEKHGLAAHSGGLVGADLDEGSADEDGHDDGLHHLREQQRALAPLVLHGAAEQHLELVQPGRHLALLERSVLPRVEVNLRGLVVLAHPRLLCRQVLHAVRGRGRDDCRGGKVSASASRTAHTHGAHASGARTV